MSNELPEGWAEATLGDGLAIDVQPGFACGSHNRDGQGIPHLRPMNVSEQGRIDLADVKFVSEKEVDRDERLLQSGDVLFNNTNSPELVGKTACYDLQECRAFSNHMTRVRCRTQSLEPHYCALALHSKWMDGYFGSICNNHVSQASISRAVLLQTPIALPPLAEQQRIVAKVEALLARVNAARQRLAKVPAILKRFRQSVLAAACSGRLTADWRSGEEDFEGLPQSWRVARLDEITTRVTDGTHVPPPLAPTGIPFVLIGNIVDKRIDWSAIRKWVTQETYERLTARCRPERGDILYTAVGATFGQALAVETDEAFIFQRHIAHIKPNNSIVDTAYLIHVLNSPKQYQHASEVARGAAQPTVTLGDLKEFEIPLAPLSEQREIVSRIKALFELADVIQKRVAAATARADKLTQAILAKAFRGELVPTEAGLARQEGRDYEPASTLLERVRKQMAASNPEPVRGQRRVKSTKQRSQSP
jgi:type I restriction enzyme S subunit